MVGEVKDDFNAIGREIDKLQKLRDAVTEAIAELDGGKKWVDVKPKLQTAVTNFQSTLLEVTIRRLNFYNNHIENIMRVDEE